MVRVIFENGLFFGAPGPLRKIWFNQDQLNTVFSKTQYKNNMICFNLLYIIVVRNCQLLMLSVIISTTVVLVHLTNSIKDGG